MTREEGARRPLGERTFVPLVMLVALLVILAYLHGRIRNPFTNPRAVSDEKGGFLFYDEGGDPPTSERAFYWHRIEGGRTLAKASRVEGTLLSAALRDTKLVLLFGVVQNARIAPEFFSVYDRKTLDRESASFDRLDFEPRHLATLGRDLYAFGPDRDGALRAARLEGGTPGSPWRFTALQDARLERALLAPAPAAPVVDRTEDAPPFPIAGPFDDALEDARLALLFRVPRGEKPKPGERPPGVARLARFDGKRFDKLGELDGDLVAFAATAAVDSQVSTGPPPPPGPRVLVFSTRRGDPASTIDVARLEGANLVREHTLPYRRGGILEGEGVASLSCCSSAGRLLLFAQVGAAIKVVAREQGKFGEWVELTRLPNEAANVVFYGWVVAIVVLAGALVVAAMRTLRARLSRPLPQPRSLEEVLALPAIAAPTETESDAEAEAAQPKRPEDASIHERIAAFGIDLTLVLAALVVLQTVLLQDLWHRAKDDASGRVNFLLGAATLCLVIAAFAVVEAVFGRTPGKRLLGIEVRDVTTGERPSALALVYRNLLRVELLFVTTMVPLVLGATIPVPVLSLLVMLATPRTQRLGDLIAGTVVQRVGKTEPTDPDAVENESDGP